MLFGMTTEIGELTDQFKKHLAYGKSIDWINVKEEIGDLMWYVSEFCNQHQFDLEEILATNIEKLQTRFPEKFDSDYAINRNLTAERQILESEKSFEMLEG
jgi:NTP pyrophosphatase (non-canonical NTP hydrolase)